MGSQSMRLCRSHKFKNLNSRQTVTASLLPLPSCCHLLAPASLLPLPACCHLLLLPATCAAAACFAKTRPEVARVWRPFKAREGLSNQTLAGLVALWSTKVSCFTRGINPLEYHPRVLYGATPTSFRSSLLYRIEQV